MGILSFIYKGHCIVSEGELPNFLAVAKLLKIQGLCDMKLPEKTQRDDFSIEKSLTEEHFLKKESSDSSGLEHFNQDHCIFRSHQNNTEKKHNGVKKDHRELHLDMKHHMQSEDNVQHPISAKPVSTSKEPSETCKCFFCGKYLSNQYNLRVHMETHQEAYYPCNSCPHVSRSRDALRKHVSYRHPQEFQNRKRKKV